MIRTSLVFALRHFEVINTAVEVGVDRGINAKDMLDAGVKRLYLIDQYKAFDAVSQNGFVSFSQATMDEAKSVMLLNVAPFKDRYQLFEMPSIEAAKYFEDETIDYIYIDAVHKYHEVKNDIANWFPKVRKGGILAGHDYKACHCIEGKNNNHVDCGYTGLRRAVDEFALKCNLELHTSLEMSIYEEDWWVVK